MWLRRLLTLVAFLFLAESAGAQYTALPWPRGEIEWNGWHFTYEASGHREGLILRNVRWRGVKVLYKASLPVIRVKYRGSGRSLSSGCGPYADRIHRNDIVKARDAPGKIFSREFIDGEGAEWLEMGVLAEIGGYDLAVYYYFSNRGVLEPRFYSSGWSCDDDRSENDHKHHPYWRLDFDVESINNFISRLRGGLGGVSLDVTRESNFNGTGGTGDIWFIQSQDLRRLVGLVVLDNEAADPAGRPWHGFASFSAAVRRYHADEDEGWEFGCWFGRDGGELEYADPRETLADVARDGRRTNPRDIVFWMIGHMTHIWSREDERNPEWHWRRMFVINPLW